METNSLAKTLEALAHGEEYASSFLLYQLSGLSAKQMGDWPSVWPTIDSRRRRHIITRLVELAEDDYATDFNAAFREALSDPESDVRAQAIEGLWEYERPDLVGNLLDLLTKDPSPLVQARAAGALGRFVLLGELERLDSRLAELVQDTLFSVIAKPDQHPEVRRRAVEAVSFSGDKRAREVIRNAYNDPDEKTQASALCAMGHSADPYWQGTVVLELTNPSPELRYEAARSAGELEAPLAVQPLIRLLDDPDREVQEMAIYALGQIGGPEAQTALVRCRDSDDEALSGAAEEALLETQLFAGDWAPGLFSLE